MSKHISVKATQSDGESLRKMHKEAKTYLENIGFKKFPLLSITDKDTTVRSFLYVQGNEKVIVEYKKDQFEEVLKLVFSPLDIKFVYDILLMRFNQIARDDEGKIHIYDG